MTAMNIMIFNVALYFLLKKDFFQGHLKLFVERVTFLIK